MIAAKWAKRATHAAVLALVRIAAAAAGSTDLYIFGGIVLIGGSVAGLWSWLWGLLVTGILLLALGLLTSGIIPWGRWRDSGGGAADQG